MRTSTLMKNLIIMLLVGLITILLLPKTGATYSEITPKIVHHDVLTMTPEAYVMVKYNDPLFWKIAECESGLNPKAKNPTSSASGTMQIINSTWDMYASEHHDKFDFQDNVEVGWKLYQAEGWRPWLASRHCWL